MMGGAESACVLLPSLSVFLDDSAKLPAPTPPRTPSHPAPRTRLLPDGGPGVWHAMVATRPGLPSHSCSRHGHSSQPQRFPKA